MIYAMITDNFQLDADGHYFAHRAKLVGPFPDVKAGRGWCLNPENNPKDNPCWQLVELESALVPIFDPLDSEARIT